MKKGRLYKVLFDVNSVLIKKNDLLVCSNKNGIKVGRIFEKRYSFLQLRTGKIVWLWEDEVCELH